MPSQHDSVSRADLVQLRKELTDLRKAAGLPEPIKEQPVKEVYASATLIESMDRLHGVLDKLVKLFENANREVYDEYSKGLHDTDTKLDRLISQNEKIARGVVALADMARSKPAAPMQVRPPPIAVPAEDAAIPPPPKFEPAAPGSASAWPSPPMEEESFMRQPVTEIASTPVAARAPPPLTRATLPSVPPMPVLAPAPMPSALPPPPDIGATAPRVGELPPPPPPPNAASRRNLLDKFSFK